MTQWRLNAPLSRLLLAPIAVIILLAGLHRDARAQTWAESFGGSSDDQARATRQTSDGGFVVAGYSFSFAGGGGYDAWVLKLSSLGAVEWQREFGGSQHDYAHSIQQTSDGGYVVAGQTASFGPSLDNFWVLKLNALGSIQWQWAYGGNGTDIAQAVQQTADGGYVVAGFSGSFGSAFQFWVIKLNSQGSFEWQKAYGGTGADVAYSIQQTSDGGYVVAGETESFGAGGLDAWVLKLDALGNIEFQWAFGGTSSDLARAVQQTADGGYIVAGLTGSFGAGGTDAWLLKLSAAGAVEWSSVHGGALSDALLAMSRTPDGGYISTGYRDGSDVLLLKHDATGAIQWQSSFSGCCTEQGFAVQEATGGYVVAGATNSFGAGSNDIWVLKVDATGALPGSCTGVIQDRNSVGSDTTGLTIYQCSQ